MEIFFLLAGVLTLLVGAIHTVLGEILIFRHMRVAGIVPTNGASILKERHVRILWASWHMVTIFGWALASILLRLAFATVDSSFRSFVLKAIIFAMLASALLVLYGTKGKHPGWIGLAGVAALIWFSSALS